MLEIFQFLFQFLQEKMLLFMKTWLLQILCPETRLRIAPNWPRIEKVTMTPHFLEIISLSIFFGVVLFLLSSLGTGPSFMSLSYLVLELWQFSFIRDWPEIRKSEIPPFEFSTIFEDWGELWIPKFARMSVIERCWMLQNARVTA